MRLLMQRVTSATVQIEAKVVASIQRGLLAYLAIQQGDQKEQAQFLVKRLLAYRLFEDERGKMNLNIQQVAGEILVVSQFTLAANTSAGNRPSFKRYAAAPAEGENLYNYFLSELKKHDLKVEQGCFGAHMMVQSVNDGPVTFLLERNSV